MKTLVTALLIALGGCAASPVQEEQTIEQFVSGFSGKELRLQTSSAGTDSSAGAAMLSGARDATFGYAGLKQAYALAYRHCETEDGAVHIVEHRMVSKTGPNLPARLQCRVGDRTLWELAVQYTERIVSEKSGRMVSLIPQASLLTGASALQNRLASADAGPGVEPGPLVKSKARSRTESAEKPALAQAPQRAPKTERAEELRLFRKNLKAGDHVQWKSAEMPAKSVGRVMSLNGDLALVQFENQAFTGQSMRYYKRSQLEPFDGIMPARMGTFK